MFPHNFEYWIDFITICLVKFPCFLYLAASFTNQSCQWQWICIVQVFWVSVIIVLIIHLWKKKSAFVNTSNDKQVLGAIHWSYAIKIQNNSLIGITLDFPKVAFRLIHSPSVCVMIWADKSNCHANVWILLQLICCMRFMLTHVLFTVNITQNIILTVAIHYEIISQKICLIKMN